MEYCTFCPDSEKNKNKGPKDRVNFLDTFITLTQSINSNEKSYGYEIEKSRVRFGIKNTGFTQIIADYGFIFHNSCPSGSEAVKKRVPLTSVRFCGYEPDEPNLISLTRVVPASVPSDFHISCPFMLSLA